MTDLLALLPPWGPFGALVDVFVALSGPIFSTSCVNSRFQAIFARFCFEFLIFDLFFQVLELHFYIKFVENGAGSEEHDSVKIELPPAREHDIRVWELRRAHRNSRDVSHKKCNNAHRTWK